MEKKIQYMNKLLTKEVMCVCFLYIQLTNNQSYEN